MQATFGRLSFLAASPDKVHILIRNAGRKVHQVLLSTNKVFKSALELNPVYYNFGFYDFLISHLTVRR